MKKSTKHTKGVNGVTSLAKAVNSEIGSYKEHYIDENFKILVKLSNGAITMSMEVVQDYEAQPNSIAIERVEAVAKTFRKL